MGGKNDRLFAEASRIVPGGVNSSVRVNKALGHPVYVARSRGSRVWDVDGGELIDMCAGHGSALLGHAHPAVDRALQTAKEVGYSNTFETEYHVELARRFTDAIPLSVQLPAATDPPTMISNKFPTREV